jgi:hypothetical protein
MEVWEKISRQRVKYIVDSYQLDGNDDEDFDEYLEDDKIKELRKKMYS